MTTAAEVFVVQLARASRKAKRIVRYLPKADRDDVMSAALLWCWEHRDSYSLTTSLDTWFVNAVRDAYKRWQRGEARNGAETLDEIATGDSTLAAAETWEAAAKLAAALPREYRRVAQLHSWGYSRSEMEAKGISKAVIDATRARIKQLRQLVPDDHEFRRVIRTASAPSSDNPDVAAQIDKDVEELEAMPRHGADCPPCWKCKYFEGYLPGDHRRAGMDIQERSVRAAVLRTERRKKRIAQEVRQNGGV